MLVVNTVYDECIYKYPPPSMVGIPHSIMVYPSNAGRSVALIAGLFPMAFAVVWTDDTMVECLSHFPSLTFDVRLTLLGACY